MHHYYYLYNSLLTLTTVMLLLPHLTTPSRIRRPPRSPLLNSYNTGSSSSSNTDFLSPSLTTLQVVAILPDDTRRSLGLSRTLHKTLNAVTATDLVSQLDFPDRNLTWSVTNFVFGKQQSSHPQQSPWKQQELTDTYEDDPASSSNTANIFPQPQSAAAAPLLFTPLLLSDLCSTLSETKALAIVSLLPHHSEQLLSLVATSTGVPLVATNPNTLSALKEVSPLYINLSQSVRHVSQCVANLLLHCHWHSFTVITDDSPQVIQARPTWKARLLNTHHPHKHNYSSHNTNYANDLYEDSLLLQDDDNDDYDEDEEDDDTDEGQSYSSSLLRPKWVTIQTRAPNAPFRVLSELTKATQGVIVLLLSQRSLVRVFHAAKQLRMLTGDYVFILAGANSHQLLEESPPPDWLPHGVLALRPPRPPPHVDKMRMRVTGTALASALTNIKDTKPFAKQPTITTTTTTKKSGATNTNMMMGGVFSGFTTRDFLANSNGGANKQQQKPPPPAQQQQQPDDVGGESVLDALDRLGNLSCFHQPHNHQQRLLISTLLVREMDLLMSRHPLPLPPLTPTHGGNTQQQTDEGMVVDQPLPTYEILNLVRSRNKEVAWVPVGTVSPVTSSSSGSNGVTLQTIRWPGGGLFGPGERPSKAYRVATIVAPPFVMESQAEDNRTCVRGLPCLKVNTINKDELAVMFADFDGRTSSSPPSSNIDYTLACCDGLAMDLLASVARELKFEIDLFLVPDGAFGSRHNNGSWNGLMGSIVSGAAHMSFAPFSVTSIRATAVDFATPFFFSGVGLLGISKERDVPLLAFLAPFSSELWAAIFITLNLTALVVAVYEWFSPFGLNPWGRQRTKNFSISSALWVVWGRLFSHLVAFKAPKSWPNKFLINVWGGFSVIFVASYTANIAALFAGMFFERHVDVNDRSLLSQRVTAVKHSATDFYIKRENPHLWEHIQQFPVHSFQHGVNMLKNGSLDLLIGDGPLLDYYRGTDSSCSLIDVSDHDKIGDDTYAVAMSKGFPLKESVSSVIAKYLGNGYMDYLQGKWYGQMHCFTKAQQQGARALGVDAVVGMLIMLGVAMFLGILILFFELFIFKHALPYWRSRPKGTLWRSPNVMFFSQKLYRFINCVELVSPHHAAKELANTLRQGQITSLFQKSVKRKEHEQRRRRKSKAQFYEMIQEIKRVQMAEKQHPSARSSTRDTTTEESASSTVYSIQGRMSESNTLADSETACAPPRLCRGHLPGEEILIAEYPTGGRRPVYTHQHSIDDSTCSSAAGDHPSSNRRIQWTSQFPPSSTTSSGLLQHRVPTPQGILRKPPPPAPPPPPPTTITTNTSTRDPNFSHEDSEEEEEEEDSSDLGNGGLRVATNGSDEDSYELYSPLDKANLVGLSKSQIIEMWRASELDLRRQLSQALKAKDQLTSQLNSRSQTPAMLLEFDQVKI